MWLERGGVDDFGPESNGRPRAPMSLSYDQALEFLFPRTTTIKFGLATTRALLKSLGDPHAVVPTIHVGGTNGKGSVCTLVAAALREAGWRVGLYTSPHLVSFRERIRVDEVPITEEAVAMWTARLRPLILERRATFFEATTAIAFADFAARGAEIAVVPQTPEVIVDGKPYLAFCSNDYLGLANHPEVIVALQKAATHYGVGSGASHLVAGHSSEHHALEEELAAFSGRERALLFSTGYMANMGAITALVGQGDAVFEDRLNHASLLDAGLLSGARFQRFLHNDLDNLQTRVDKTEAARKLIVVDGVFSMDGDCASLSELAALAQKNNAWLMVDDAHGFGSLGKN
jgi:hypothetical protein